MRAVSNQKAEALTDAFRSTNVFHHIMQLMHSDLTSGTFKQLLSTVDTSTLATTPYSERTLDQNHPFGFQKTSTELDSFH
ncbi:unnamed protein product [Didymodactylos carnosus]|uniref:Uncharacterized protein n=1 Tax=Didymodactylos carnosus TaxID=1234261 RepID=A0A815JNI1_9BILA|nr:unnamed protein product [Didymodactylos carnosus]CAF1384608.1 unnamed protein product [Didymodactylos carnosus]CAF3773468.1 unnamed protein product [Didymodactylos carnosus]CAF4279802.1 unnamed protein product [Didymodactylos carnosus]